MEAEDAKESIEELSSIFSVANFPSYAGKGDNLETDEEEVELDIGTEHSRYKKICVLILSSYIPVQLNLG